MMKANLIAGNVNQKQRVEKLLWADNQSHHMCMILKLATGLDMDEVIDVSLKIMGILSNNFSKEELRKIYNADDILDIGVILADKLPLADLEKFRIKKKEACGKE